jgi:hypothetical protein
VSIVVAELPLLSGLAVLMPGAVVGIDRCRVACATGWAERLSGSEQGLERFLSFDVVVGADSPHRGLCPTDEYEKQALGDLGLGQIFFGKVVLALPDRTVDHRNVVGLGVPRTRRLNRPASRNQVGVLGLRL